MAPRITPLVLFLCCFPALPVVFQARADIKGGGKNDIPSGAPAIKSQTVNAVRGQPVTIKLTGKAARGEIIFIIRSQPRLGSFVEEAPVVVDALNSTITYIPSLEKTGDTDEFLFAARGTSTATTSDAEKVTIRITDPVAKLTAPGVVGAGRVVMGHPKKTTFKVKNGGNGAWKARVPAPKGWRWILPADGNFDVAPGATLECEIQCEGAGGPEVEETVTLHGVTKVSFTASIVPPFSAPAETALKWDDRERLRAGAFDARNADGESPVTLRITGPEWLTLPAEITLPPGGSTSVPLTLRERLDQTLKGTVKLAGGTFSQEVTVTASPAPALLAAAGDLTDNHEVAFGKLDAETLKTARRKVTLKNTGGSPAVLKVTALKDFGFDAPPPAAGIPLAPGAETTVVFRPPAGGQGTHREPVAFTAGDTKIDLQLTAEIPASAMPSVPGEITRPAMPMTRVGPNGGEPVYYTGEAPVDFTLPRVHAVEPVILGPDSVSFTWDQPAGEGWKFQLCYATPQMRKDGAPIKLLQPLTKGVTFSNSGRKVTAVVTGLSPEKWYKYSVQVISPDGRASLPGKEFGIKLATPLPSHLEEYWAWYACGGVFALLAGYWLRKRWKAPISAAGL